MVEDAIPCLPIQHPSPRQVTDSSFSDFIPVSCPISSSSVTGQKDFPFYRLGQNHPLHKLKNANTVANYHEYYQTRIKNGTANGAASNAYPNNILYKIECTIMQYGNLVQSEICSIVKILDQHT